MLDNALRAFARKPDTQRGCDLRRCVEWRGAQPTPVLYSFVEDMSSQHHPRRSRRSSRRRQTARLCIRFLRPATRGRSRIGDQSGIRLPNETRAVSPERNYRLCQSRSCFRSPSSSRTRSARPYPASASSPAGSSAFGASHSLPHFKHFLKSPRALVNFISAPM